MLLHELGCDSKPSNWPQPADHGPNPVCQPCCCLLLPLFCAASDLHHTCLSTLNMPLRPVPPLSQRLHPARMHLQDLCALLRAGWRDLDTTNLALTFQQLTLLAQQAPGGAAAFTTALHADSCWPWLLAQVASAAAAPDFLNWHASSLLWALCKLHGVTAITLHALHAALARALAAAARNGGSAGASSLPIDSLLQVLWAFAVEPRLQPMLQQLKPELFAAMWVAAPHLASKVTTVGKGGARDWARVTRQLLLPPPWHIAAARVCVCVSREMLAAW